MGVFELAILMFLMALMFSIGATINRHTGG